MLTYQERYEPFQSAVFHLYNLTAFMLRLVKLDRIYNPVQDDYVTFLETAESSGGKRTLLEIEVAPRGGVAPHFHTQFTETFTAISGDLSLLLGDDVIVLSADEVVKVDIGVKHRFFNPTEKPIVFQVDIQPGNVDFERALRVGYGLARDGKTTAKSVPKNPLELAVMAHWSNTEMPSAAAVLVKPIFKQLLALAKRRGVDKRLIETYC